MRMSLKLQPFQSVLDNVPMIELKDVFTGTPEECKVYAERYGYVWKDSRNMLFGGYWYKKAFIDKSQPEGTQFIDCSCLLPDTPKRELEGSC
jgi:hypothetical protein